MEPLILFSNTLGDNTGSNNASNPSVMTEVTGLIRSWEEKHTQPNYDPIPTLTRLAEIIEIETENYLKMDPDPFDERHPSRTDPDCKLGQVLKALFRKDNLMNKLVNDYLRDSYYARLGITGRDIDQLNIAACRLMLDIMPGLETSVVFQDMDTLIQRLIKWVTQSCEPLQSYATGLLAAAMEISAIALKFREQNSVLVPLLLQRLRRIRNNWMTNFKSTNPLTTFGSDGGGRPFAHLSTASAASNGLRDHTPSQKRLKNGLSNGDLSSLDCTNDELDRPTKKPRLSSSPQTPKHSTVVDLNCSPQKATGGLHWTSEASNSSWAELETFMIGTVQMFPPTDVTRQILILRYLTPMGEYQEVLGHVFEHNALELILYYVNVRLTKEARLAFEALKFLAALLYHKKFCIEFIQRHGLEALLEVPRPSIAATGVSTCLYYLGYCEEAMERICLLPKNVINNMVKYALWLLECSHDSGRCQAIMFFGLTFQFKVILDEFDDQDGLRKLHNVIATLPILLSDAERNLTDEDQEFASRQIVRHVCVAYRRYLEAHLAVKVENLRRSQMRPSERPLAPAHPSYKALKSSSEEIQQHIETLQEHMPMRTHWQPVDQLMKLGDITLFLRIIAFAYEWNYSGRAETVRSALDVLAIACVMPKVQLLFCERIDLPEENLTHGMNIILGAAEGEIVADVEVQKAALRVICNCVCAPIHRVSGAVARFSLNNSCSSISSGTSNSPATATGSISSPHKKTKYKSTEDVIQKVWDSVRSNSGIMVLIQLMNIKTPITDADCIRTLACKALAGLARCQTVRQTVSKLPLFTTGQLQTLMRDPILQEKRVEHVAFQKYAVELLERLSGNSKHNSSDLEVSLSNIHRANVVAQTKIQFNDRQLLQLIHQHLVQKGYSSTAEMLVKEANLSNSIIMPCPQQPTKFRYLTTLTPSRHSRPSFSSPARQNATLPLTPGTPTSSTSNMSQELCNTPTTQSTIKIIKKNQNVPPSTPPAPPRLQKQISCIELKPGHRLPGNPHFNNADDTKSLIPLKSSSDAVPRVTLDSIITEYLTNQHALCKNPMATCPQFNLFVPHKCPDPKPRIQRALNFATRTARRQIGIQNKVLDRRFVHSRFCPVQTLRATSEDGYFSCAKFMPGDKSIIVGDYTGDVRIYNLHTGNEESMFQAHDNYVVNLEPNRTGKLLLTSCTWGQPVSALWSIPDFQMKFPINEEEHVEFSKVSQDRIIGTKGELATIFDVNTGQIITRLTPSISNQYTKNKATFSWNDELVLSDGVLFDVNSGKEVNKLDKLNQTQSGVFHPNGLEIVSNTEVWDIRTFHLLKTVPALHQNRVIFAPANHAIYAIGMDVELDDNDIDTSFKTVDANDYSSIATIDVKRNIHDLDVNKFDTQICLVENQGMYQSIQESVVRIYDVGRQRDDEDEQDEEEEEEEEEDMDGSDDDASENEGQDNNENSNENNDEGDGDDDDDDDDDDEEDDDWVSYSSVSSNDEFDDFVPTYFL